MKLRRTMKAQSPKKKEKKKGIVMIKKKKKKKDPGQARGYVARRRIPVRPEDMQQDICSYFQQKLLKNLAKPGIIFVTHSPSSWDPEWIVREEWFGR